jgi:hypothetical protein
MSSGIEPRTPSPENGIELLRNGTPRRWCSRIMKTGERCKKAPIYGGTVCSKHGGRAPHIKAAAKRRLEEASDSAAVALLRLALTDNPDVPYAVRLGAVKDALDRAGVNEKQALELSVELKPWQQIVQGQLTRGPRSADPDVVDAELVPEGAACRACGLDFSEFAEPEGGYPALCKVCRAGTQAPQQNRTPPPSPREHAAGQDAERRRSAASGAEPRRATAPTSGSASGPARDPGDAPGASERGLLTAEEAVSRSARDNPRPRRRKPRM